MTTTEATETKTSQDESGLKRDDATKLRELLRRAQSMIDDMTRTPGVVKALSMEQCKRLDEFDEEVAAALNND